MTGQAIAQQPATESGSDLASTERLVTSTIGTLELFSVHLGRALGLCGILAQGPVTYPELAARAGIAPRYAREWLEQQAVAGLPAASTDESPERNHRLPAALALPQSAGLGTALRPATVHHLAGEAGFASTRELAIRHDFFRLYVMRD